MANDDLLWTAKPPPPRQPKPGEKLCEFLVGHDRYLMELRDHGQWGVETQIFRNEELVIGWRFETRALAILWAEEMRKDLEIGR